jgi:Lipocalin-like domain
MRTATTARRTAVAACVLSVSLTASVPASGQTIQGRWKLVMAEDLRPDGTVARYPWGRRPVGSIVVQGGSCYLQIMSTDVPDFQATGTSVTDQMKAALLSNYIAYSGPCTTDDASGTLVLKVDAAWRPDYVGTEQRRFYRFDGARMYFGPSQGSIRTGADTLTRRLTLERP